MSSSRGWQRYPLYEPQWIDTDLFIQKTLIRVRIVIILVFTFSLFRFPIVKLNSVLQHLWKSYFAQLDLLNQPLVFFRAEVMKRFSFWNLPISNLDGYGLRVETFNYMIWLYMPVFSYLGLYYENVIEKMVCNSFCSDKIYLQPAGCQLGAGLTWKPSTLQCHDESNQQNDEWSFDKKQGIVSRITQITSAIHETIWICKCPRCI